MRRTSKIKVILAISFLLWLLAGEAVAQGWYNSSWLYRKKITIDYTKVGATGAPHVSFPVLVSITDADLSSKARSDGYDILFTSNNGTTSLPYEREKYTSGTGTLVAWVQIPSLSAAANTDIYMYYGNSGAADQQNGTGTWETNFKAVWHLAETTGGTGASQDATSNGNNGTPRGTQANLGVASQIDGGVTLNGTNDYISTTTQYSNPQTLTVSIWFKTTSASGHKMIGFESSQTGTASGNYDRHVWIGADGKVRAGVYNGSIKEVATTGTYTDGNWHYAAFTHASNTLALYIDGASAGSIATTGAQNFSGWFRIGSYKLNTWTSASDGYFGGSVDEARLAFTARSAGWILTEYNNQSSPSTFYNVAGEERPTKTWDGGASTNNWGDAANWNPDGVPSSGNDVNLTGANTINVNVAAATRNLTLNNASLTLTIQSGYSLTVSGDLTITTGTLNTQASFPTVSGTVSIAGGTIGYTASSGSQTVAAQPYNNLTISGDGTKTLGGSITPSGNLTISAGTFDLSSYNANRASAGGILTVSSGATLSIGGTGTLPSNYSTHSIGATSTINYAGTTQTVAVLNSSQNYGHLTISGSGTKTLAGTENVAGNLTISAGTFDLGTYTINRASAGGTLTVSNGASLKIGSTGTIPSNYSTHSVGSTSTIEYAGTNQSVAVLNSSQNYGNLTISGSGTKTLAGTETVNGTLTLSAGTLADDGFTLSVNGNIANGASHTGAGKISLTGGSTTHTLSGSGTFTNLQLNDANGATLNSDVTINGTLTLTSGNVTTSSYTLSIGPAGTVARTVGYIAGNLQKYITTGATSASFEIGDVSNYAPVNITFSSVSTAGNLTATTTAGDQPDISRSTINASKSVNRYWALSNSGIAYTDYSATFNFVSGDVDAGANTSSFIIGTYSGGSWIYPSVGTKTTTSTQAAGLTAFGDFQIGELLTVYPIGFDAASSATSNGVSGTTLTWSHTVGNYNNLMLIVGVQTEGTSGVQATGVTYGGVALTKVDQAEAYSSSYYQDVSQWYLIAPPVGTANVVVTWGTSLTDRTAGAISLYNLSQQAPEASASNFNNSGATTTNITTLSDGACVVDMFGSGQGQGNLAPGTDQTQLYIQSSGGTTSGGGSIKYLATAGTTSMTWTQTGINRSAQVVSAYAPAAVGPKTWDGGAGTNNWGDAANWNPDGVPTSGIDVSLTGANTININVTAAVNNLTLNNANLTLTILSGNSLTVSANLTLTTGTLNTQASFPTVNGTVSLAGGTFGYTAASGSQTVTVQSYSSLTISGGGTKTLAGNITPSGDLTISAGSFDLGSYTANRATAGGTLTVSSGATLLIAGTGTLPSNYSTHSVGATSTINYYGTTQSVAALNSSQDYGNVTISGSGTKTLAGNVNVSGNLSISAGTFDLGSYAIDRASAGGTLTVSNGATLLIGGTGTLPSNYSTHSIGSTSTINYSGTIQTVATLNSSQNYGYLTISGSGTKTLAGNVGVVNDLTISAGTFDLGTNTCNRTAAGGTLSVSAGATLKAGGSSGGVTGSSFPNNYSTNTLTGTVEFSGTGAQTIPVLNYTNLAFSNVGTKSINSSITATGTVTINSGAPVSVAGGVTLQVKGGMSNAGVLTNSGTILLQP